MKLPLTAIAILGFGNRGGHYDISIAYHASSTVALMKNNGQTEATINPRANVF
jgi:hypothetical protein